MMAAHLFSARSRSVAKSGIKPMNQNTSEIVKYVETANTSHQWAPELRPVIHAVWIREQPVGKPRPAEMQHRKHARAGHSKQGHGLGKPVDGVAPFLSQQQKNGGN